MSREIPIVVRTEHGGLHMPSMFTIAALLAMAFSAFIGWRWFNGNVLSLGVHDGETTVVNQAQLLEKVRAFELVTIKHTYQANAKLDASKGIVADSLKGRARDMMKSAERQIELARRKAGF